jgi:hypothetical protein
LVNVTKYKDKHLQAVLDMHVANNYDNVSAVEAILPKLGFIAYCNSEYQYIAAGFLRMVEGNIAQIDTLVTNPAIESSIRHEALNLIVDKLLESAKELKLLGVYAFTSDYSTIKRAEETGFRVKNQSVITLIL